MVKLKENSFPGFLFILIFTFLFIMTFSNSGFASAILYDGSEAAVSIIFHHAETNQLEAINLEMEDMPSIISVIVERVGNNGYMTQQQLLDLQSKGHEISSHSESHASIVSNTTPEKLYYETVQSKIDLENMGFDVYGFIPPRNELTDESFVLIQKNYEWTEFFTPMSYHPRYAYPDELDYSIGVYGLYHLPSWGLGNNDTLNNFQDAKNQIDYAIAKKYWIAFNFHSIVDRSGPYDISPAIFHEIIEYIKAQRDAGNLNVITMAEGVGLSNPSLMPPKTTTPLSNAQISTQITPLKQKIPEWIKNNARWWAEGKIDDNTYVQTIQFMVKNNIISIPDSDAGSQNASNRIPDWIKNNARWWAEAQIDEDTFVQGIQFSIKIGIIKLN